jgi:OmpA-OmpF porin, OOP family
LRTAAAAPPDSRDRSAARWYSSCGCYSALLPKVWISVAANLIGEFVRDFRGDTLNRVAFALGESPVRIQTGLGAVLPAIMGGLAAKASTTAGASSVIDLIRLNQLDSPDYADASAAIGAPDGVITLINVGRPVVDTALAGRTSAVIDWISSFSGINRSSSISLLTLVLPLVVGQIVRTVGKRGLDAWSLKGLLTEQRAFLGELPGLSAALGTGARATIASRDTERRRASGRVWAGDRPETPDEPAPAWWKWAVPLALLALIALYFWVRRP